MKSTSIRVLMVSQRLTPYVAGAELQLLGLSRALIGLGASVEVATTNFTKGLRAREVIDGVPVRRLCTAPRFAGGTVPTSGHWFEVVKILQIAGMASYVGVHARNFDVVHAHCISASSLGAVLGARAARIPVLLKPSLGGEEGELHKIIHSRAARPLLSILRRVDRFAVIDASVGDELARIGIAADRLVTVGNGVDLERFRPCEPAERANMRARLGLSDGPLALFVGQLVERKGVGPLLEAWRTVRSRVEGARLLFAGHGALLPLVERAAAVPDSGVSLLGVRSDVVDLMRVADVLVLPSHNESFGNVIVEALACGVPVVTGPTGVATQVELDGIAGHFVDPDDPASIAAALEAVLTLPDQGDALGSRGRELSRRFDFKAVARDYLTIYERMLEVHTHGRRAGWGEGPGAIDCRRDG